MCVAGESIGNRRGERWVGPSAGDTSRLAARLDSLTNSGIVSVAALWLGGDLTPSDLGSGQGKERSGGRKERRNYGGGFVIEKR